jgi:pilus assembly protein CpaF
VSILQHRLANSHEAKDDQAAYRALKARIRERLLSRIDPNLLFQPHDASLVATMRREITSLVESDPQVPTPARQVMITKLCHDIVGFGPIQPLIDDPEVSEIMVNRFNDIWSERAGRIHPEPDVAFHNEQQVRELCERIALPLRRRIDESNPILDGRLPDGSRVNAVLAPVALNGTCLTIRKFAKALTVARLQQVGTLNDVVTAFLRSCVLARCGILVIGATSSGKTALLNALASFIPDDERIVTIEDAAELMLQQPHVVRLETRPPNVEGRGDISVRDLVRNALRMRPDRIVVGECRGPEALDMMQAANTGHDGTFSTLHANSPGDALARLETMVLMADSGLPAKAVRSQIASAFDLVVEVGRLKTGLRRIFSIAEVNRTDDGEIGTREIFRYDMGEEKLLPTNLVPERTADRCRWAGVNLEGVEQSC